MGYCNPSSTISTTHYRKRLNEQIKSTSHVTIAITNCNESNNLRVLEIQSFLIYFLFDLVIKIKLK